MTNKNEIRQAVLQEWKLFRLTIDPDAGVEKLALIRKIFLAGVASGLVINSKLFKKYPHLDSHLQARIAFEIASLISE